MALNKKPNRSVLEDTDNARGALLDILLQFYDALVDLLGTRPASSIPALQSITLPTHAAIRLVIGDYAGNLGPRAAIVTGRTGPLDGGEGVYVWDATSILDDDDAATMQPLAISQGKPGRWRKGAF